MRTIQEWRVLADLTQLELAVKMGVTPTTIYNWEKGRSEPKATQLRQLALILGVKMDDIDIQLAQDFSKKLAA